MIVILFYSEKYDTVLYQFMSWLHHANVTFCCKKIPINDGPKVLVDQRADTISVADYWINHTIHLPHDECFLYNKYDGALFCESICMGSEIGGTESLEEETLTLPVPSSQPASMSRMSVQERQDYIQHMYNLHE